MKEVRAGLRRTRETLSNFTPFLKPRRGGLVLALCVLLLETITSLGQPWPLALPIDYVLTDKRSLPPAMPDALDNDALLLAAVAFLIVFIYTITRSIASFRRYLLQKLGQQTVFAMREALYS